jgi:hypothetical protein
LTGSTQKLSEECVKNPTGGGGGSGCCRNGKCAATTATTAAPVGQQSAGGGGGGAKTVKKKNNLLSVADRRNEYAVRPGYSSGASSYDGSVTGDEDDDLDDAGAGGVRSDELAASRHSDILALGTLRQDIVAEGDLTKTVVRIEVCNNIT